MTADMSSHTPGVDESVSQRGENELQLRAVEGKSQGQIVRARFFRHRLALIGLSVLTFVIVLAYTANGFWGWSGWWQHGPRDPLPVQNGGAPTMEFFGENGIIHFGAHPFGQSTIGEDVFAQVMAGIVTSVTVIFLVGIVAAVLGILFGALSGFFRGFLDGFLMRLTDLVITVPSLVLGAVLGAVVTNPITMASVHETPLIGPAIESAPLSVMLAIALGLIMWPGLARLVRGEFLSLREREFVDAARVAGASNRRIIFKHMLPNAVGVAIVNVTLLMSQTVLLETSLAYLGFGIGPPEISLGWMISEYESAFTTRPWLFWWPGGFIVILALCINFIGDGLRDAYDPRQKGRLSPRQMRKADALKAASMTSATDRAPSAAAGAKTEPRDGMTIGKSDPFDTTRLGSEFGGEADPIDDIRDDDDGRSGPDGGRDT